MIEKVGMSNTQDRRKWRFQGVVNMGFPNH